MSAVALLNEIRAAGIAVNVDGDRLHVEARHGTITPELRDRMKAHKPELVAILRARAHLLALAADEGIERVLVDRLDDADLRAAVGLDDAALREWLRLRDDARIMAKGLVPWRWQGERAAICAGCGPVVLWPGAPAAVQACPWCWHRRRGVEPPRPSVACSDCKHFTHDAINPPAGAGRCGLGVAGLHWPGEPIRCGQWAP